MSLRLTVEGDTSKVSEFINRLCLFAPMYRFYDKSKLESTPNESRIEYYFDENSLAKPQLNKRSNSKLKITDGKGKNIDSLRNTDIFQLVVAGDYSKVKRFWQFMKTSSEYRLLKDFRMIFDHLDQKGDMHIVMQVEETPLLSRGREECKIQIRDQQGKEIIFSLLDTQMVEMSDGMIYIRGKNFDIFAEPKRREVVDCTVVDETEKE